MVRIFLYVMWVCILYLPFALSEPKVFSGGDLRLFAIFVFFCLAAGDLGIGVTVNKIKKNKKDKDEV